MSVRIFLNTYSQDIRPVGDIKRMCC